MSYWRSRGSRNIRTEPDSVSTEVEEGVRTIGYAKLNEEAKENVDEKSTTTKTRGGGKDKQVLVAKENRELPQKSNAGKKPGLDEGAGTSSNVQVSSSVKADGAELTCEKKKAGGNRDISKVSASVSTGVEVGVRTRASSKLNEEMKENLDDKWTTVKPRSWGRNKQVLVAKENKEAAPQKSNVGKKGRWNKKSWLKQEAVDPSENVQGSSSLKADGEESSITSFRNRRTRNISAVSAAVSTGVEVGARRPFSALNKRLSEERKNVSDVSTTFDNTNGVKENQVLVAKENEEVVPQKNNEGNWWNRKPWLDLEAVDPSANVQASSSSKPEPSSEKKKTKKNHARGRKWWSKRRDDNEDSSSGWNGVGQILDEVPIPARVIANCCSQLYTFVGLDDFEHMLTNEFRDDKLRRNELGCQLKAMIEACKAVMRDANFPMTVYSKIQGDKVRQMFEWSKYLRVNEEAFFRAIELYDRFRVNQEEMLGAEEVGNIRTAKNVNEAYKSESVIMCICIGLAGKLHAIRTRNTPEYDPLCTYDIQRELSRVRWYQANDLFDVEKTVWKILKFRLNWVTPFDITSYLVATLDLNPFELKNVYCVALLYLQYSYIRNADVYVKVDEIYRNEWLPTEEGEDSMSHEEKFKRSFEYNIPLRAAAVVCAAVSHIGQEFQTSTIQKFSNLVSESEIKISTVAHILQDILTDVHPTKIVNLLEQQFYDGWN